MSRFKKFIKRSVATVVIIAVTPLYLLGLLLLAIAAFFVDLVIDW